MLCRASKYRVRVVRAGLPLAGRPATLLPSVDGSLSVAARQEHRERKNIAFDWTGGFARCGRGVVMVRNQVSSTACKLQKVFGN